MVTDVFTREAVTRALPNKNAETVARAAAEAIPNLVQDEGSYVVTTDEGNKFREPAPGGGAPAESGPRTGTPPPYCIIQTLKKDLAGQGGKWDDHVADATGVLQDNAEKFQHNKALTEGRQARLQKAGAFRAPTNANRSFQPSYGPARELAGFDSMTVRATDSSETLLKHALPVPRGSAEPRAALTQRPTPAPVRQLRDFNRAPPAKSRGKKAEQVFRELN